MRYEDAGVSESSVKDLLTFVTKIYPEGRGFIGSFSAPIPLKSFMDEFEEPILLLTTDGVGTKILVAKKFGSFDVIGNDCVAMNVNDIAAQGGKPLFFLDYLAFSKLKIKEAREILRGIVDATREADVMLVGGETAQLPDMFKENNFDVAGFAVGIKEKKDYKLEVGDVVLGLPSSGPHANGFSLIRRIVSTGRANWEDRLEDGSLWELVLRPTRIYSMISYKLFKRGIVKAASNITGGGIPGNLCRILTKDIDAIIDRSSWKVPKVFSFLIERGDVPEDEAFRVFNMGIGFIFILGKDHVDEAVSLLKENKEEPIILGTLRRGSGKVRLF